MSAAEIRVVVLSHVGRLSGAELGLCRLLPAMRSVRAHVILAEDGPLVDRLRDSGVSVEVLPMGESGRGITRECVRPGFLGARAAGATLSYVARVAGRIHRLRPDLVHASSLKALVYGSTAARLVGVPVLWHAHDRIAEDYLPRPAITLVRALARLATTVVANSRSTLETLGPAASRGVVIPYPVVAWPPRERAGEGGPLRVGMVGRITPWKGQHVFLNAFARAFPGGEERAVIVGAPLFGESGYELELHALVPRVGLGGRVEFRGFRENVAEELERLDVLVHASIIPEPFGQVVLEGMSAGLPVVASGAGGPAEIVAHGRTGFLYQPGDAEALAERLLLLGRDPTLRRRIGAAARMQTANLEPDRIAELMTKAYRMTLARTTRRSP